MKRIKLADLIQEVSSWAELEANISSLPADRVTNKFISKATSETGFCHCGLSAILFKERFPTSGNDITCVLTYELLSKRLEEIGFKWGLKVTK